MFAALLAGACRFDTDYGGTSYRCDDQPICPAGYICIEGVCRGQPIDAGPDDPDAAMPTPILGDIITYTFDDYQITDVAHDRSGHRHDGTDRSLTLVAGRYGQGLNLNGSPLEIPDTGDLYSPGQLTIEMWLFLDHGGERQALFSDYAAAAAIPDTELSLEIEGDRHLELLVANGCEEAGEVTARSEGEVPVATWTHVAVVWEVDEVRFYIDGEEAGSAPIGAGCERSSRFAIGARGNGSNKLTGVIDEFKVSSAAKSAVMIQESMNWDSQAAPPNCGDLLLEQEACDGPGLCCAACQEREDATACNGDLGACMAGVCIPAADEPRVADGLVALYRFDDMSGTTIADSSGNGNHLTIGNGDGVAWGDGSLEVTGAPAIESSEAFGPLSACLTDGEVTIEAWVRAKNTSVEGRVAGLIAPGAVNLSLSQGARAWMSGVNSSGSIENGHPVVDTPPADVSTELTHLVMSRSVDGWRRLYVDGALRGTNRVEGALGWAVEEQLVVASDTDSSDRWQGTYHLVALYCRALDEIEVAQNFAAGAD